MSRFSYDPEPRDSDRRDREQGEAQNPFAFQGALRDEELDGAEAGELRFNSHQLEEFRSLGKWLSAFGWINLVFGGLACLTVLGGFFPNLVLGPLMLFVGFWCTTGGGAFRKVGAGYGNPIPELMEGVANVRGVFRLWVVIFALWVLLIVGLVALGVGVAALRPRG